jgi:hypothetical protein
VSRLNFCQLMLESGKVVASHPGYQADEMKEDEVDPLLGTDTGGVGSGLGSTSSQDGAATTRDATRAETKRGASMAVENKEGRGEGWT